MCRWAEEAGADALHISSSSFFPHPLNPPGGLPASTAVKNYDAMIFSGRHTLRNYLLFRAALTRALAERLWTRTQPSTLEGLNVGDAAAIRRSVTIPVLCTGAFQTASYIRPVISGGYCDAVAIARPLLANVDLVKTWTKGEDKPERPCTYCNKCLVRVLEDPLGCYDLQRYDGDHDRMMKEVMAFYAPDGFQ